MKIDYDLFREILLKVESKCRPMTTTKFNSDDFPDNDWPTIQEHFRHSVRNGFIEDGGQSIGGRSFNVRGLELRGQEFIEITRACGHLA